MKHLCKNLTHLVGRAIDQAVSRLLPTAADRVQAQVRLCGICGGVFGIPHPPEKASYAIHARARTHVTTSQK
jgi:hypothetical protein